MIQFNRGVILLLCISIWGCSTANDNPVPVNVSGKHPAGWAVTSNGGNHPAMFLSAPDKCKECHGTDLRGGITKVDCFGSCHAQGPYGHAPGWSSAAAHGTHAKAAVSGVDGMGFCTNCHGVDFSGGTAGVSCFGCHNTSPHAVPWLISTGATTYLHSTTSSTNAITCGGCHGGGAKLSTPLAPPANAGCFNNTLCHGVMGHAPSYPGATHKSEALVGGSLAFNCIPCHELTNPAGIYPAAVSGTPPVCSGCHPGWAQAPSSNSCGACHGVINSNTGMPSGPDGTPFPNHDGQHSKHSNVGITTCAYCHSGGGTGAATHGNSNRTVKTLIDVVIQKDPNLADPISISKNNLTGVVTCTGLCHMGSNNKTHTISDTW